MPGLDTKEPGPGAAPRRGRGQVRLTACRGSAAAAVSTGPSPALLIGPAGRRRWPAADRPRLQWPRKTAFPFIVGCPPQCPPLPQTPHVPAYTAASAAILLHPARRVATSQPPSPPFRSPVGFLTALCLSAPLREGSPQRLPATGARADARSCGEVQWGRR